MQGEVVNTEILQANLTLHPPNYPTPSCTHNHRFNQKGVAI